MDFRLSDDQRALRAGMRDLLAARFPREALRALVDGSPGAAGEKPRFRPSEGSDGPVRELWRVLGDAGLFALRLPEEEGGAGLGLPEAVLLFEEAGRALLPGPLVATHLAAGLVPGAAEGTRIVTAVDGTGIIERLTTADAVLLLDSATASVLATDGHGTPLLAAGEAIRSVDPATPLHRVRQRPAPLGAGSLEVTADAARLRRAGALLTAAQQLGSAGATLGLAVEHARRRVQFGRPVGSFQAVQHLCADMCVRTELARVSVYSASLSGEETDISASKMIADGAAVRNARDCLQVCGGLGFTWEADVHLHLKRAWVRAGQWQSAAEAEEFLAGDLLADRTEEVSRGGVSPALGSENAGL
ncbi:acyl-CoA dehydrogenase family protein [Streptomyces sp. NPDC046215]|uniref:Acyl-CoA dehydrogenase n=1 Tax=Streptomyces stramineus TaxID=173861 RepID=A0ABN1AZ59_9ACTN